MADTPLGNIVRIRSENDTRELTAEQRAIRNEWRNKQKYDMDALFRMALA